MNLRLLTISPWIGTIKFARCPPGLTARFGNQKPEICPFVIVPLGSHSEPLSLRSPLRWLWSAGGFLRLFLVLGLAAGCSGPLRAQVPGVYEINMKTSHIQIHLYKAGFLSGLGDTHLIALTQFSGFAEFAKAQPWKAQVTAEASSLRVLDPRASASQRQEVQATMLGPRQLDVSRFPMITLRSLTFTPTGQDTVWRLKANLTVHGITRPVEFSLAWHEDGDNLRVQGKKMLSLREFGIEPISRAMGAVRVKNEFEITYDVDLEFKH
jgi:polyisoprenoid-binding protein YceI